MTSFVAFDLNPPNDEYPRRFFYDTYDDDSETSVCIKISFVLTNLVTKEEFAKDIATWAEISYGALLDSIDSDNAVPLTPAGPFAYVFDFHSDTTMPAWTITFLSLSNKVGLREGEWSDTASKLVRGNSFRYAKIFFATEAVSDFVKKEAMFSAAIKIETVFMPAATFKDLHIKKAVPREIQIELEREEKQPTPEPDVDLKPLKEVKKKPSNTGPNADQKSPKEVEKSPSNAGPDAHQKSTKEVKTEPYDTDTQGQIDKKELEAFAEALQGVPDYMDEILESESDVDFNSDVCSESNEDEGDELQDEGGKLQGLLEALTIKDPDEGDEEVTPNDEGDEDDSITVRKDLGNRAKELALTNNLLAYKSKVGDNSFGFLSQEIDIAILKTGEVEVPRKCERGSYPFENGGKRYCIPLSVIREVGKKSLKDFNKKAIEKGLRRVRRNAWSTIRDQAVVLKKELLDMLKNMTSLITSMNDYILIITPQSMNILTRLAEVVNKTILNWANVYSPCVPRSGGEDAPVCDDPISSFGKLRVKLLIAFASILGMKDAIEDVRVRLKPKEGDDKISADKSQRFIKGLYFKTQNAFFHVLRAISGGATRKLVIFGVTAASMPVLSSLYTVLRGPIGGAFPLVGDLLGEDSLLAMMEKLKLIGIQTWNETLCGLVSSQNQLNPLAYFWTRYVRSQIFYCVKAVITYMISWWKKRSLKLDQSESQDYDRDANNQLLQTTLSPIFSWLSGLFGFLTGTVKFDMSMVRSLMGFAITYIIEKMVDTFCADIRKNPYEAYNKIHQERVQVAVDTYKAGRVKASAVEYYLRKVKQASEPSKSIDVPLLPLLDGNNLITHSANGVIFGINVFAATGNLVEGAKNYARAAYETIVDLWNGNYGEPAQDTKDTVKEAIAQYQLQRGDGKPIQATLRGFMNFAVTGKTDALNMLIAKAGQDGGITRIGGMALTTLLNIAAIPPAYWLGAGIACVLETVTNHLVYKDGAEEIAKKYKDPKGIFIYLNDKIPPVLDGIQSISANTDE